MVKIIKPRAKLGDVVVVNKCNKYVKYWFVQGRLVNAYIDKYVKGWRYTLCTEEIVYNGNESMKDSLDSAGRARGRELYEIHAYDRNILYNLTTDTQYSKTYKVY